MKFILLAFSLLSLNVFGQVERDVIDLNDQIRSIVLTRPVDNRTLLRVKNQLENVLLTLQGSDQNPIPNPVPTLGLKCVARDNDNAAPWIFAGERSDFSIIRYPQYTYRDIESCRRAATTGREMAGGMHTCTSRDNDGAAPFVMASFYGERTTKRTETFRDIEACFNTIKRARANYEAFVTCISRDNDGVAPFVKIVVKFDGASIRQINTFQSLESCFQDLK
jgi:hypothetical protein